MCFLVATGREEKERRIRPTLGAWLGAWLRKERGRDPNPPITINNKKRENRAIARGRMQ